MVLATWVRTTVIHGHRNQLIAGLFQCFICNRYVPLPKSSHASRIKSNADVFEFVLSGEQMAMLDAMDRGGDGAVTWNPVNAA